MKALQKNMKKESKQIMISAPKTKIIAYYSNTNEAV